LGRPSKYTQEFRRDAIDLVRSSGRPINEVARELGMSHETLRNWVRKHEHQTSGSVLVAAGGGLSEPSTPLRCFRSRHDPVSTPPGEAQLCHPHSVNVDTPPGRQAEQRVNQHRERLWSGH
jgi:transposase